MRNIVCLIVGWPPPMQNLGYATGLDIEYVDVMFVSNILYTILA